jgi:ParB family transcriptional regulator, chromosome partitioning protein
MTVEERAQRHYQERRLGRTVLKTYRGYADLYELVPNDHQPRLGPKEDPELQRQIEANEGIFEPLLVEPHPDLSGKYRIIDGDRRWTNSQVLVEQHKKDQYRRIPIEVTDRTLTDEERLRVWIYIHRQRKEWDTKEKEMVAYSLVDMVGRASAANILGITVRELDKLVEIYELADKRLKNLLPEPGTAITWAREINSLSKNLLTPSVFKVLTQRIAKKEITNSKDVRKLRKILKDPVAQDKFMSGETIEAALNVVVPSTPKRGQGILGDLEELGESLKRYPWTTLASLKGDPQILTKLEEAEQLLKDLKKALSN